MAKKKEDDAAKQAAAADPASLLKKITSLEHTINRLKRNPKDKLVNKQKRKHNLPVKIKSYNSPKNKSNNSVRKTQTPQSSHRQQAHKRPQPGTPMPLVVASSTSTHISPPQYTMLSSSNTTCREEEKDLETMITISNNGFTDLSTARLPAAIVKMLGYGIKHIPQSNQPLTSTILQPIIDRFSDKIAWRYYFEFLTEFDEERVYNPKFKLPPSPFSEYDNYPFLHDHMKAFNKESLSMLTSIPSTTASCNYTVNRIRNLSTTMPEITCIAADKNLGLVVLDTLHYHKLVMTHLDNRNNYTCLGDLDTQQAFIAATVEEYYQLLSDLIIDELSLTEQEERFLQLRSKQLPQFHILAKIHKAPLKGRPIVGATAWITTNASKYLDYKLQEYVDRFSSILDNTQDFVARWSSIQFNNTTEWLVSLDVESLYTNISLDSTFALLDTLNLPLANLFRLLSKFNYFTYNNQLYHQIDGIAMGSNCAVSIANIYMGTYIDLPLSSRHQVVSHYCRYIDDIALIFTGTETELNALHLDANQLHAGLTFTIVKDRESLDVLDVTFYYTPDTPTLQYRTYQKPINRYLYIPYFSCHPPAVLRGFIIGELTRYKRNNSLPATLHAIEKDFYIRLLARGYPKRFLDLTFTETRRRRRVSSSTTSRPRLDTNKDWIVCLPYSNDDNTKRLVKYWKEEAGATLPAPYTLTNLTVAWSPPPSLGALLLRSTLSTKQQAYIREHTD